MHVQLHAITMYITCCSLQAVLLPVTFALHPMHPDLLRLLFLASKCTCLDTRAMIYSTQKIESKPKTSKKQKHSNATMDNKYKNKDKRQKRTEKHKLHDFFRSSQVEVLSECKGLDDLGMVARLPRLNVSIPRFPQLIHSPESNKVLSSEPCFFFAVSGSYILFFFDVAVSAYAGLLCLDLPTRAYAYHIIFDSAYAACIWCFCGVCVLLSFIYLVCLSVCLFVCLSVCQSGTFRSQAPFSIPPWLRHLAPHASGLSLFRPKEFWHMMSDPHNMTRKAWQSWPESLWTCKPTHEEQNCFSKKNVNGKCKSIFQNPKVGDNL